MLFKLHVTEDFYLEACCKECNEVIHTHFNCPVCGQKDAATDYYGNLFDGYEEGLAKVFSCEECRAKFKVLAIDEDEFSDRLLIVEHIANLN